MFKRISFYAVFVFLIAAFMTAGCAKQDVVKKDEGILPAPVSKQAGSPKSNVTSPKQTTSNSTTQVTPPPATALQTQKKSSTAQLQSALEKIYFDFDSADLSESSRSILAKNSAALSKEPTAKIRIEGNCDERGSAEYNLALGERRAKAAQQYLINMGVKPGRLSVISYGKEKPAAHGSDETAMAKNRRDEFVVIP
ncbi:MAG: peptidoglycan-associated lipoprotein Pal [Desulfuromonadaceae bacterium]|nr:peptidoglycan-associated lipoprotein Pal [Desulfuromonadaceae bacterium]